MVLAKMLEHNPALVSGKRAVELGAGQGIVGIAAALLGADVMVTDHPGGECSDNDGMFTLTI